MNRVLAGLLAIALAFLALPAAHAQGGEEDLLPVEQAFALRAEVREPGRIALAWDIAPDYYLYRGRIKASTTQAGLALGAPELPPGEPRHDEFFGDVEIYHGRLEATLPYTLADAGARQIEVTVSVQGCHEVEPLVCYPPHPTRLVLELPGAPAAAADAATPLALGAGSGGGLLSLGASPGAMDAGEPLPPEEAFVFDTIALGPGELLARWTMPKGYYLYRDRSTVKLLEGDGVELGAPRWPAGVMHDDGNFGRVEVFFDQVELPIAVSRQDGKARTITLEAEFQGCQDNGLCYPVMSRRLDVALPAAGSAELAAINTAFVAAAPALGAPAAAAPASPGIGAVLLALLLALGGGLILNLMPCVLPILSLKVLGLAQGGENRATARRHALAYTAGVLASFAVVGLVVIGLRATGLALGWGFQLQQPLFVAALVYVLFAIGLALSGVVNLGAGLAGLGQNLGSRSGPAGDFFTGVLAVVVASPCTAPLMGTALAFAFTASAAVALAVFLALGLGLALPFLLVAYIPALATRLPRPGAWMETLKQFLAFPMYLTAVWLVWVLGHQRGIDAVGWVLIGAVLLALGLWWWEARRQRGGLLARAAAVAVLALALVPLARIARLEAPARVATSAATDFVPYSAERLAALRAEGRGVFVDMGADWCVTCKVNEKAVLETEAFQALLAETNAVLMKGDWTNVDPAITAFLDQYKAVGVPLYVAFRAGEAGPGEKLPTLLTHDIVARALRGP